MGTVSVDTVFTDRTRCDDPMMRRDDIVCTSADGISKCRHCEQ